MIDLAALTADCQRVKQEADRLLETARHELERLDRAHGSPAELAVAYSVTTAVAEAARAFVRAQAVMVIPADSRYAAAQAVLGYCDEAARRLPPVRLGAAS